MLSQFLSLVTCQWLNCYFGGAKKQAAQIDAQVVPPPIPPVQSAASDTVAGVGRQTKIAEARRKGFSKSILAGEDQAGVNLGGGRSLLGSK